MTDQEYKDNLFKADAKSIVDTLYDNKMLNEKLNRDDMKAVEYLLHYMMNSRYHSQMRAEKLMEKYITK